MNKTPPASPNPANASPPAARRAVLAPVLLGLTGVVVALTVYLAWFGRGAAVVSSDVSSGKTTLAQEVLVKATPLMRQGAYGPARDLMLAYVRSHEEDIEIRPLLAEAYWKLGQNSEAERTVDEIIKIAGPGTSADVRWLKGELMRLRGLKNYPSLYRSAASAPTAGPKIWGKYGLELYEHGDREEALRFLNMAVEGGSTDPRVLGLLGEMALADKQYDPARDFLLKAVHEDPNSWRLHVLLAEVYRANGSADEEIESLSAAAAGAQGVDRCALYVQVGDLRQRQGHYREAADAFVEASHDRAVGPEASFKAAQCFFSLDQLGQAMHYIDQAAVGNPTDPNILQWRRKIEDARFSAATGPASQPAGDAR